MKLELRTYLLSGIFVLLTASVLSQNDNTKQSKTVLSHEMSADERSRQSEIGLDFIETDPPTGNITNIAEFDRASGALVAYPFGIPLSLVREISYDAVVTTLVPSASAEAEVRSEYIAARVNMDNCVFMTIPTNSYWTRDYGPMYITYGNNQIGIVDFPYNRPRPEDDNVPRLIAQQLGIQWFGMNVIHTGGNYMTDGYGYASSTTLTYNENPSLTPAQVNQKMQDYLGIDDYSVVEDPNNTYIDHIDCWGKYLAPDKVLIRSVPITHPQYNAIEATAAYFANKMSIYGTLYKVYRVYTPSDQPYTNSYIINNKVFVPVVNSPWDDDALESYRQAMPGYTVYGIAERPENPWQSTDALHCRAHEMADLGMLYLKHIPLLGNVSYSSSYALTLTATPYSGQTVIGDSVILHYRINPNVLTPYTSVTMTHTTGVTYTATIDSPPQGSTVEYFLSAVDNSGRKEMLPFMGAADPHTFYVGTQMSAVAAVNPSSLNFTAMKDTQQTKDLTILNSGETALNYTFSFTTDVNDTLSFSLNNSPSFTSWNSNTLTETNWTTFAVTNDAVVSNVLISYQLNSDEFYHEGSVWIESPSGTKFRAGKSQLDGYYSVVCPVFTGENMNGSWKVWLEDSNGDGGHQATNVRVKIVKDNPNNGWLSLSSSTGIVDPGSSAVMQVTADAQDMALGTYQGKMTLWSNDPTQSSIVIPVTFEVTINIAAQNILVADQVSVNPNPFNDRLQVEFNILKESLVKLELYNSVGTSVYSKELKILPGQENIVIPSGNLPEGIYMLKVDYGNVTQSFKLVKGN